MTRGWGSRERAAAPGPLGWALVPLSPAHLRMGDMGRDSNGPGTTGRGAEHENNNKKNKSRSSRRSGNFVSSETETGIKSEIFFFYLTLEALIQQEDKIKVHKATCSYENTITLNQQVETHFSGTKLPATSSSTCVREFPRNFSNIV